MTAAATAWDTLAAELRTAASSYRSVVQELISTQWMGPSSRSMASVVLPYVSWLAAVSILSEETAVQARAAAAAFDAAFAMTVPPWSIAANRASLMALSATNFFGQNTPAIAATETEYMQMWAQDAVAMFGYAGSSAVARQLTPFGPPPTTTSPPLRADQAVAVAQATGTAPGNAAQTAATASSSLDSLIPGPGNWWGFDPTTYKVIFHDLLQQYNSFGTGYQAFQMAQQLVFGLGTTAGGSGAWYPTPQFSGLSLVDGGGFGALDGIGDSGVSAGLGQVGKVGMLSVPQSWTSAVSPISSETVGTQSWSVHEITDTGTSDALLQGMPATSVGRRGSSQYVNKYGFRYRVLTRSPSAG